MAKNNGIGSGRNAPKLPKQQLTILALCRFAEPVAMTSVYPYIPEMIKSFNVPSNKIASYAGLMSLLFSLSQALVGISWGRASDQVGRKPTILLALTCTMISSILFGFSSSLPMAFIARSMQGLSNGNVGILRTAVAELVPERELQPRAFSIMPLVWTIGSIFGPSIGGSLVNPVERYPDLFGNVAFLRQYPFALPNLLISLLFMTGIASGFLFLRETLADKKDRKDYGLVLGKAMTRSCHRRKSPPWYRERNDEDGAAEPFLANESAGGPRLSTRRDSETSHLKKEGNWSQVFTYQSKLNLLVYTFLAMHSVSFDQLLPVFLDRSPVQTIDDPRVKLPLKFEGGFNLDSGRIGALFTAYGIFCMIIQFVVFPPLVRKYGALNCYKAVAVTFPLVYICIPYVSLLRTNTSRQIVLLMIMGIKGFCAIFAFPCSTILLTNSADSLKVLGTLNGVATSISALGRATGPALAGFMFTLGADEGYMILPWWTLAFVAVVGAIPAWWLVEMEGFGSGNAEQEEVILDEEEETAAAMSSPRLIAVNAAPASVSLSPGTGDAIPENLAPLTKTTSRKSLGEGRGRRESFTLRRMHSPVGTGEGLASRGQRRYSTDLGTTLSGHGTGGTSYH